MAYAQPQEDRNYGYVTGQVQKTFAINVTVERPMKMDNEVTEVHLIVNGRKVSTMHPERARRLGLVS